MKTPAGFFVAAAIVLWLTKTGKIARLYAALTH